MSTAIHLADLTDLDRVLALLARSQEEQGRDTIEEERHRAVAPLLEGSPHGAVWLIGPRRAPLGHAIVCIGWSVRLGGLEGWVDEVYVRPSVRRRGIGTEVLHAIAVNLAQGGLRALHVRLPEEAAAARRFCARAGFREVPGTVVMTDPL